MKALHVILVVLVVVLAAASAAVIASAVRDDGTPDASKEEEEEPTEEETYPEGVTVDLSTGTVTYAEESRWTIYDLLETYYVVSGYTWTRYTGDTSTGTEVVLSPGMYRITVGGETFDVTIPGTLERTVSWTYDMGGTEHAMTVTYTLDVSDLAAQKADSQAFNGSALYGSFSNLPDLVQVTSDVTDLEGLLESEYLRIGGDSSDEQGYANFLAAFVQLCVTYPHRESGHGADYCIYGSGEYWARPLETLCILYGDCEDTSALLCALYVAAGYTVAMGGASGHVYAGVAIDGFEEVTQERLKSLDIYREYTLAASVPVEGSCEGALAETVFYGVETIYDQLPVGYLTTGIAGNIGSKTTWGTAGFYPVA